MTDEADELRRELQIRMQELEALTVELRHLQADLEVKEEYIRVLQREAPGTPAELASAQRFLALRSRLRDGLGRHPLMWRVARRLLSAIRRLR